MTTVHIVLPGDIDDPATPSGGNAYDRRVCDGLAGRDWQVQEHPVPGSWPVPSSVDKSALAGVLSKVSERSLVLIDGLVASAVPDVLVPQAHRLCLVILLHMPLENEAEGAALAAAQAIITTSEWARDRLLELYPLAPHRVHVATPGVDIRPVAVGSESGQELLCVAAVTLQKGHEVLAEALGRIRDLPWNCVCVGSLTREPEFVRQLESRLHFTGPLTGAKLDAAYAKADLLVLPSRGETYGMVITEALAHGIPVIATKAKGIPEALGNAPDGSQPGLLAEPGDSHSLELALRSWLTDSFLRQQLRSSARGRRTTLAGWSDTVSRVAKVLEEVR